MRLPSWVLVVGGKSARRTPPPPKVRTQPPRWYGDCQVLMGPLDALHPDAAGPVENVQPPAPDAA